MMRDYFYDFTGEKSWRDDKKVFVGARGYWPYDGTETMSTQAWVEHQFVGVRKIRELSKLVLMPFTAYNSCAPTTGFNNQMFACRSSPCRSSTRWTLPTSTLACWRRGTGSGWTRVSTPPSGSVRDVMSRRDVSWKVTARSSFIGFPTLLCSRHGSL